MNRDDATGNGTRAAGDIDSRIYGFRHGNQSQFGASDSYKFNAGFYDGHVETLGDLEGANPTFWNPTGTIIEHTELTQDVIAKYTGSGVSFQVP